MSDCPHIVICFAFRNDQCIFFCGKHIHASGTTIKQEVRAPEEGGQSFRITLLFSLEVLTNERTVREAQRSTRALMHGTRMVCARVGSPFVGRVVLVRLRLASFLLSSYRSLLGLLSWHGSRASLCSSFGWTTLGHVLHGQRLHAAAYGSVGSVASSHWLEAAVRGSATSWDGWLVQTHVAFLLAVRLLEERRFRSEFSMYF